MSTAICLLIVNRVDHLPRFVISKIREKSDRKIFVGYLSDDHVSQIRDVNNIEFIDLTIHAQNLGIQLKESEEYLAFDEADFFNLVRLKWSLLSEILQSYEILIYTDLDVLWLDDVTIKVEEFFELNPEVSLLVQDASQDFPRTSLCMGFAAFKKNFFTDKLIAECSILHTNAILRGVRYGDDNAISDFYESTIDKWRIAKLPQTLYPIGKFSNLALPFSLMRGLEASPPKIFHANYVVGLDKKMRLLKLVERLLNLRTRRKVPRVIIIFKVLLQALLRR